MARPLTARIAFLAGLAVSAVLSGCADAPREITQTTKGTELTPDEAKTEIRDMYELTRDAVGGTWTTYSRNWYECSASDEKPKAEYSMLYRRVDQPSPGRPADVAEEIRGLWKTHGHDVEVVFDTSASRDRYILSDPPWMSGSSPDLPLIQFTISDNFATFMATSRCIDGDAGDLGKWEPPRGEGEGEGHE